MCMKTFCLTLLVKFILSEKLLLLWGEGGGAELALDA
jgi:hypothetical protein